MKQKLRNIKFKMLALWRLLTHEKYFLLVCNGGQARELGNLNPLKVVETIQLAYGLLSESEIINELNDIAAMSANGYPVYYEAEQLIKKLEKQQ